MSFYSFKGKKKKNYSELPLLEDDGGGDDVSEERLTGVFVPLL